jgi:DNA mismatch repair protein MutS2
VIADLEDSRRRLEKDQEQISAYREEMERLKKQLSEQKDRLEERKAKILREANEEAAGILREAKEVADQTIRNFHKYGAGNANMAAMEREREAVRKKMQAASGKASMQKKQPAENTNIPNPNKLRIGDDVKVLSMNQKGVIHTLPDKKNELIVSMGIMQTKVKLTDIEIMKEEDSASKFRNAKRKNATHTFSGGSAMSISPEIKLLGLTVDEAISKLDKYIDDAYVSHLKNVRIVHGKGTGALRKAVQDYLATNAYVKSFDKAAYGEGDDGVTIANLF